jgi:peptidoglycan biosynthesis protein MviN/MurJ (putative lipid II flippase)
VTLVAPTVALYACFGILVSFVGLLYVTAAGRRDRDSNEAIRARIGSVTVACLVSGAVVWFVLPLASSYWNDGTFFTEYVSLSHYLLL